MEWTTVMPSEDGYYWARGVVRISVDKYQESIDMVRVIGMDIEEPEVEMLGTELSYPLSAFTHWIPIEEPSPPDV